MTSNTNPRTLTSSLIQGWLFSRLFSRAEKGSIKFVNHLMGGAFGLLKGVLIGGILIFALSVFPVDLGALQGSVVAPYCVRLTQGAIGLITRDLKEKFKDAYQEVIDKGGRHVERV